MDLNQLVSEEEHDDAFGDLPASPSCEERVLRSEYIGFHPPRLATTPKSRVARNAFNIPIINQ